MRFKLDENLPLELAEDLQRLGHEIDSVVAEGIGGAEDRTVLKAARTAERILLTLDKGIGNLQRYPLHEHAGVVLFRPDTSGRRSALLFIRSRLSSLLEMQLAGRLTVVTESRIRVR
ncbi:MAG TPA: DUF5615 family PIN-like protein [Terriglobales bacterium]|nr:DUF5615 family PIN-like protein [Terriglobales bacterium]